MPELNKFFAADRGEQVSHDRVRNRIRKTGQPVGLTGRRSKARHRVRVR